MFNFFNFAAELSGSEDTKASRITNRSDKLMNE